MKQSTKLLSAAVLALALSAETSAFAGSVLIVNGSSQTSEPGTTADITGNLSTLHTAVGNVVTVSDAIPADLTPFSQIWDIRFSNVFALSASERANYVSYMAGGGGMFVMGENSAFAPRNTSVLGLISEVGGGNLGFTVPSSTQDVLAPFTGPNPVTQITYAAPGGVALNAPGTGDWITKTSGVDEGTGIAFGVGDMPNAPAGALTVIFDVNFMQNLYDLPNSQNLTKNLINFVGVQVGVPDSSSSLALFGTVVCGFLILRRKN